MGDGDFWDGTSDLWENRGKHAQILCFFLGESHGIESALCPNNIEVAIILILELYCLMVQAVRDPTRQPSGND